MADHAAWAIGYARQARADFQTFEKLQFMTVPECHKLQFLQMACEKLVKAHLRGRTDPADLQASHAYVAGTLPVVLRQQANSSTMRVAAARTTLQCARLLAAEIDLLAPSVTRNGQRPDNCEYPWEDAGAHLHRSSGLDVHAVGTSRATRRTIDTEADRWGDRPPPGIVRRGGWAQMTGSEASAVSNRPECLVV